MRYNGCLSKSRKILTSVPQGSVLGPFLFLLYVNDIHTIINKDTKVACYADDIAIWTSDREIDISEKKLQHSLNGILKRTQSLKLKINVEKTTNCLCLYNR
ncbi:hypothetical protein TNIN_440671 [Trichonephila inaurata madagascariensis]|uniref:Reverse transcriptase domain-containing protein n=1 Tax=Trichonephila inaurata madagascariensis TaxID=2747483 RepID=A0A8X7CJ17_9ARAC|nr:hypothetical protein TNIN_440671 [Trichonephila inaurata madagascariensis]